MFFRFLLKSNCIPFKSNTIYIKKFIFLNLPSSSNLNKINYCKKILYLPNNKFETINSNYLNKLLMVNTNLNYSLDQLKLKQFFYEYHNLNLSYKHYIFFKNKPFTLYNIEVNNLSSTINKKELYFDVNGNMSLL